MSLVLAVVVGVLVGIVIGALGAGGGIITIPVLMYALNQPGPAARHGSLVVVGVSAIVATWRHHRRGRVRLREGLLIGAIGAVGAFAGGRLEPYIPEPILIWAFVVILLWVGWRMIQGGRGGDRSQPDAPQTTTDAVSPRAEGAPIRWVPLALTSVGVGLLTGLLGVGGGFAIVPALTLVLGYSMTTAIGTSVLVIAVNSAVALASRVGSPTPDPDWTIIAVLTAFSVVGSLVGERLTGSIPPHRLKMGFGALLLVIALYTGLRTGIGF